MESSRANATGAKLATATTNNMSNNLCDLSATTSEPPREVGYVLLEECQVQVPAADLRLCNANDIASAPKATPMWQDIDVTRNNGADGKADEYNGCDLLLRLSTPTDGAAGVSWRAVGGIAPFNGSLPEMFVDDGSDDSSNGNGEAGANKRKKRRSDASLLVGLGLEIDRQACRQKSALSLGGDRSDMIMHFRDIRMESVRVMFWEQKESSHKNEVEFVIVRASLLVTFSLPAQIDTCSNSNSSTKGRSLRQVGGKSGSKDKMLSQAHQLLGSIIRCDWENLDATVDKLQQKAHNADATNAEHGTRARKRPSSFFPDELNVEQLYERISGAGTHFYDDESGCLTGSEPSKHGAQETAAFLNLPQEMIASSIAPYLRARSLYALRVTNRKLHRSLRGVVPGLKLRLFRHQVRSLEWMEDRERHLVLEEGVIGGASVRGAEAACGGDSHRAVTGGATVSLSPRPSDEDMTMTDTPRIFRFDSESGRPIDVSSNDGNNQRRTTRCARGGLLCDDPGLGKTISVMSLILRTFGLSTEPAVAANGTDLSDDSLFQAYWNSSFITHHVRRPHVLNLISRLIKCDDQSAWFVDPIDIGEYPDYLNVVGQRPISLQEIRMKYDKESDCRDFPTFEAEVKLCLSNAMVYNPPHHGVHQAAKRLIAKFDELIADFKRKQVEYASKSTSRMARDSAHASLVDMFEAKKRSDLQEPLVTSSSTLLVVPTNLLLHWEEQMLMHIHFGYIARGGSPPIYYHTSSKTTAKSTNNKITFNLSKATNSVIFVDDGSKELPSPDVLARFPIVVTNYKRFTSEWKNGNIEQEVRATRGENTYWGEDQPMACSLLKVKWLRVIIDEGHVMGKGTNNLIQFASWLSAQRRWGMTGTPTPQMANQSGLRNLFLLTNFLNHDFFNRRLGREKVWNNLISQGWNCDLLSSFFRLKHLVSYLMVRHTKLDMIEIPPPTRQRSMIDLSKAEVTAYNTIVTGIRTNILTTSMEGKTSGWQDSLLNPRQSKSASQALTNLRVGCCGSLQIIPQILNKHWSETLEMLRESHNLDDVEVTVVNNFIFRAQNGELSSCHKCGVQLQLLFVIPCGHLVCTECISNRSTSCPVCEEPFDVDDFQRLQPGFELRFSNTQEEEKNERERKFLLQQALADSNRPAIIDVDDVGAAEENGLPNPRPVQIHRRGESCKYSNKQRDGRCIVCREEHFECDFMAHKDQRCSICYKEAEPCPDYASKAKYVIGKLLALRNADFANTSCRSCNTSPMAARLFAKAGNNKSGHRPLKAIVFSQFRTIYEYFGDRLIRRFGGVCVADYTYAKGRSQELRRFIHDPNCFVMLLSMQGSTGLDLSFVTHIFFLDTIYDKSLEAQVIARAYRMGATGPVHVEQLTATGSVEEVMNRLNDGHEIAASDIKDNKEKHAKLHLLLKSAKLIRPRSHGGTVNKRKYVENEKPNDRGTEDNTDDLKPPTKKCGVRFKD